jgi:Holliday junction resolvase RusA-like endonuclease
MRELDWHIEEWNEGGLRHVRLKMGLRVMPYVRQTTGTRWRSDHRSGERAQEYNRARGEIRDAVYLVMQARGVKPFKEVKLGFEASFWLSPKRLFTGKRWVTVDNPERIDLGNLEKALEDALQGVLLPNDRWIWKRGQGEKHEGEEDAFEVHVWELDGNAHERNKRRKGVSPTPTTSRGASRKYKRPHAAELAAVE